MPGKQCGMCEEAILLGGTLPPSRFCWGLARVGASLSPQLFDLSMRTLFPAGWLRAIK